jgi:hypothetical protein
MDASGQIPMAAYDGGQGASERRNASSGEPLAVRTGRTPSIA